MARKSPIRTSHENIFNFKGEEFKNLLPEIFLVVVDFSVIFGVLNDVTGHCPQTLQLKILQKVCSHPKKTVSKFHVKPITRTPSEPFFQIKSILFSRLGLIF